MIAWDTETALFRSGVRAPELACVSWIQTGKPADLEHVSAAQPLLAEWLKGDEILVGHNVAYDFAVICAQYPELIPLVFEAYERDRVTDTKIRQQLLDIAAGEFRGYVDGDGVWHPHNYDLDSCLYRADKRRLDKDTWRMRYGEFINVPLKDWPEGARTYPKEDAIATERVALWQHEQAAVMMDHLDREFDLTNAYPLTDQYRQTRAAFALYLVTCWGLRTDGESVAEFERQTVVEYAACEDLLKRVGLIRQDGSADTKKAKEFMEAACAEEGVEPFRTPKGDISLGAEACDRVDDEIIKTYSKYLTLRKVLSNDVELLRKGTVLPVHPQYGLADTGRTTCSDPNIQALRREKGIREAFRPRQGKIFIQADYAGLELHTLAEWCLKKIGYSELAKKLNAGIDVHLEFAAEMLDITYEEAGVRLKAKDKALKNARQAAKAANFGLPGGLGVKKFCKYAKATFGVEMSDREGAEVKSRWLKRLPEMTEFFQLASKACNNKHKLGWEEHLYTGRISGGARYTSLCNRRFQGLGADAMKNALWQVQKACYVDRSSPLFGTRVVACVHDELIAETDLQNAHLAAGELGRLMIEGAKVFLPNVPPRLEPLIMPYWTKDAEPTYNEQGQLIPWQPKADS